MTKRAVAAAAVIVAGLVSAAGADPVSGLWKTQPGETGGYAHVEIAPCGASICGTIVKTVAGDAASGIADPTGKPILWDMKPNGDGRYTGGKIWAPDTDKTYKSQMTLQSPSKLKVQGCVGVCTALTSRSQTWTRIN